MLNNDFHDLAISYQCKAWADTEQEDDKVAGGRSDNIRRPVLTTHASRCVVIVGTEYNTYGVTDYFGAGFHDSCAKSDCYNKSLV